MGLFRGNNIDKINVQYLKKNLKKVQKVMKNIEKTRNWIIIIVEIDNNIKIKMCKTFVTLGFKNI